MDSYGMKAKVYKKMRDGMMMMGDEQEQNDGGDAQEPMESSEGNVDQHEMIEDYDSQEGADKYKFAGEPGKSEMKFGEAKGTPMASSKGISSYRGKPGEMGGEQSMKGSNSGNIYQHESPMSPMDSSSNYAGQKGYSVQGEPGDGSSQSDFDSKDSYSGKQRQMNSRKNSSR